MKTCYSCNQERPIEQFDFDRTCPDGRRGRCKPCQSIVNRAANLKRWYGMTVEEYDTLLDAQAGRCAICRTDTPGGKGRFHVDHDHNTGVVRGLLCHGCNIGIGSLGDNSIRLRLAADYLDQF